MTLNLSDSIPFDPAVKTGRLSNGMKYYLKKTDDYSGKIRISLIVKAGNNSESSNERELAHLLEHLAFKGTKNFSNAWFYFQSKGLQRASEINASTGFDNTDYFLQGILSSDTTLLSDGLRFLKEVAAEMLLTPASVQTEKGALLAEINQLGENKYLIRDFYVLQLLQQSGAIGATKADIKKIMLGIKPEAIQDFYEKWYRPDRQAIIITGDIDEEEMEKKIIQVFSDLKPKTNDSLFVATRPLKLDGKNRLFAFAHPEIKATEVQLVSKYPSTLIKTLKDYREYIIKECYNAMVRGRMSSIVKSYNGKVSFLSSSFNDQFNGQELAFGAFESSIQITNNDIKQSFITLVRELQRIKAYGFTKEEFSAAIKKIRNSINEFANNSDYLRSQYRGHFIYGEIAPGPLYTKETLLPLIDAVTVGDLNKYIREFRFDVNRDVVIRVPEELSKDVPDENKINLWLKEASASPLKPYKTPATELSSIDLPAFKKLSNNKSFQESKYPELGITKLNLSNGVTVYLKPVSNTDQVEIEMSRTGGALSYDSNDSVSAVLASELVAGAKVGGFSSQTRSLFQKQNNISMCSPFILSNTEGIRGTVKKEGLEAFLQLTYLYLHEPVEISSEAYKKWMLNKMGGSPDSVKDFTTFSSAVFKEISNTGFPKSYFNFPKNELEQFDLKRAIQIYREKMSSVNGFNLVITGNLDPEAVMPLVLKYIGNLTAGTANTKIRNLQPPKASSSKIVYRIPDEPVASVQLHYLGSLDTSSKNNIQLDLLRQMVEMFLYKKLREERGGIYSLGGNVQKYNMDKMYCDFSIGFPCQQAAADSLIDVCKRELESFAENSDSDILAAAKLAESRELNDARNSADFWKDYLVRQIQANKPLDEILNFQKLIDSTTKAEIESIARQVLNKEKLKVFVLLPESLK